MLPIIGALLPTVGKILDKVIPDKNAAREAKEALARMDKEGELATIEADLKANLAQIQVNLAEAQSSSLFVSGWRPAVGWTCCAGFAYHFVAQPFLTWALIVLDAYVEVDIPALPTLDTAPLMTLLMGMLGLGSMRTLEKFRGVARPQL